MAYKAESEMKEELWDQVSKSPFVMLELDNVPHSAIPMTAQLDKAADVDHSARHSIWFFSSRDNALARMGPATATFAAKDHKLFARLSGSLCEEQRREIFDALWSNPVAAWFPEGKDSPTVLLMRMDLREASIWSAKMGAFTLTKMLLGISVVEDMKGHHARTAV